MNIADQLQQIEVFLTEDRFIPILEEVTVSPVAAVVGDGVSGEKSSHHRGDRDRARPKQEVNVIRKQDPGIAGGGGLERMFPKRSTNPFRSWSSWKILLRSIPLTMT